MRRVTLGVLALSATFCNLVAGVVGSTPAAAAAPSTYYVAPTGSDSAAGTESAPFKSVARAVQVAATGSTIVIGEGRYHESVQVFAKDLDLRAAAGQSVVFDGAVPVQSWTPSGGASREARG